MLSFLSAAMMAYIFLPRSIPQQFAGVPASKWPMFSEKRMEMESIEAMCAASVPLTREHAATEISDPISELNFLSARKAHVWGEMKKIGHLQAELRNEYARIEKREEEAAAMIDGTWENEKKKKLAAELAETQEEQEEVSMMQRTWLGFCWVPPSSSFLFW